LRALLRPVHRYFADKIGWIKYFSLYEESPQRDLLYPQVKAYHRDNPYRRHQLCHKTSARTYKRIRQFVEARKLDDFAVAKVVLTMPKFMSNHLAGRGKLGRSDAWRLFDGWWGEDLPAVVGDIGLASHTNLHVWRSEKPTEPHFHFHVLIPNYGLVPTDIEDEDGQPVFEFVRWRWHRQRGGRMVPFSDSQLEKLKELWRERLIRYCRRHGVVFENQQINIYVQFVDEWPKLLHAINYNGRHWSENFAEYSNDNPDCPDPPSWLEHYENRARCKGWWSNLKQITVEDAEKEKVSPYSGEPMKYIDRVGFDSVINRQAGFVEFVHGQAVEGTLNESDRKWLKGVMYLAGEPGELGEQDTT
jgi:hypothetical protein